MAPALAMLCGLWCLSASFGQEGQSPKVPAVKEQAPQASATENVGPSFRTELVSGKVGWMSEVLETSFGISTVPEVSENILALVTTDHQVLPLAENSRGRAFRKDQRLRDVELELLVRRYAKQPMVQILKIFQSEGDNRYEIDYWCDVCAIVMYETGPCACCQDHNRLRKQPVSRGAKGESEE